MNFDVLIDSLWWFVQLKIKNYEEIVFNVQAFAKRFSNDNYRLKIAI